ncbi:cutinase transcription factor 1 beta [Fusarium pseudocircinatum]|uniref:Cutinase transcription factor 1 beta n=1 Tax=Fusarium pseudocircinatum TaxID=56676 RepID=A0A8H5LDR8_9HYPO|nr:cutinase transcription factor 1 beta [Fusarium pseudocircinatum]
MSDQGVQDTSISSGQTPSAVQLSNSQSESPHWDTSGLARESGPSRWGSMTDGPSDQSPDHSQQAYNASSATSNRDTIVVNQNNDEGEITVALDTEVHEAIQIEHQDEVETPPIANATSAWAETLEEHESDGNRVPFYPVFMCAATFVEDSLFLMNLFHSPLTFKRNAFQRAKTLYDADYEKNKVTLIQSVFLMGHFYADAEDRLGPWHWNGIAISLSHTIGLHMLTSPSRNGIRPLWRRIWWCIYYREVWLSMGQGRPMRISLDHCSTPMPGLYDTSPSSSPEYRDFMPEQIDTLLGMWLNLIGVTRIMGRILSTNYTIKAARPSRATIEKDENEIRANWIHGGNHEQSPVLASHTYQYRLHTQAAIIALYRPFLHETPDGVPDDEHDSWKTLTKSKLRTAAAHATHAINCMMAEELIQFAQTIAVLTISPPIQVHLLEMASSKSSSGKLAKHNLALCLLALDEMRKYYVSADAAYKLFDRARIMVEKTLRNDEIVSQGSAPAADCPREPQGVETSEWLDESASMGYEVTSVGLFSALWMPFANLIPDESLGGSF